MSEKNYHHGDLRSSLIAAARAILEHGGLKALTLRACAREAGVSHAAPQHHFRNLDELLAGIAESGFIDFVVALDAEAEKQTEPRQCLIAMGVAYVAFAEHNPALYRVMFGFEAPNIMSDGLEIAMRRAWQQLHDAVAAVSGDKDADNAAILLWSVVHGHAMLRAAQCVPPMIDPIIALEKSLETIVEGIASSDF